MVVRSKQIKADQRAVPRDLEDIGLKERNPRQGKEIALEVNNIS